MGHLKMLSKHHIRRHILKSLSIILEIEEQRPVERTTFFMKHAHLRVVVVHQGQLLLHCVFHELDVAVISEYLSLEIVGLLIHEALGIVVAGEWLEGADMVPAGAQFPGGVTVVAADVRAGEGNAHYVLHHHASHGPAHVCMI